MAGFTHPHPKLKISAPQFFFDKSPPNFFGRILYESLSEDIVNTIPIEPSGATTCTTADISCT